MMKSLWDIPRHILCPVRPPQTAIGRCLHTDINWDIAGERARPGCRFRCRAVVGMARCAVRRPALSCPRRAGRNSAGQKRESASGDIAAQCPYPSRVRPLQTAIGRPAGTLPGSAPAPVVVFAVAPKPAIPTGLNHSAQGCAGALPWVGVPQIFLPGTGCITSRQTG